MNIENLSTLKIHKLTQAQYDRELAAGNIDPTAIYLTPDNRTDVDLTGYATEEYVNTQIAAIPTPDVSGQIGTHNTSTSAHNDIRNLITGLTTRLNALADSDDTTLDQMSEIVAYIKSNKSLIEQVTTNKINVADIIDNLTTNVSNKPLSAAQGVALKALIDAIDIPTKVSELTNDSRYITASGAPVQSVNGKTGVVQLTASDVGALPNTTQIPMVPTKVSELFNDSGFITASDIPEDKPTIIDVLELPTENIDENVFYRKLSGNLIYNQSISNTYTVYCVETLPETGEPATNVDNTQGNIYYDLSTNEGYGYVDSVLSAALSVPAGWYPGAALLGAIGEEYAGIITNILDDPMDNKFRILLEYVIYSYKDVWTRHKSIGWYGTGRNAEVFNHPSNTASGYRSHAEGGNTTASGIDSHAEGYHTTASGENSHAEGYDSHSEGNGSHAEGGGTTASGSDSHAEGSGTIASGNDSHAEGYSSHAEGHGSHAEGGNTTASGSNSHAEGYYTTASGSSSHAEGFDTIASGYISHTEGYHTTASGKYQHVQGKYNIEDTKDKYAHIIGNGTSDSNRSNAHTIDWNGNAWFAGDVYVGGANQDKLSERLATENFVADSISAVALELASVINVLGDLSEDTKVTLRYEGNRVSEALFMRFLSMVAEDDSRYICIIRMMTPMESSNKIVLHSFLMSEMSADGDGIYALFKTYNEDNMLTIRFPIIEEPSEENPAVGTFSMIPFNSTSVIPEYTEEDEGKVLRIVNGVPTWVSIPNAEEATF